MMKYSRQFLYFTLFFNSVLVTACFDLDMPDRGINDGGSDGDTDGDSDGDTDGDMDGDSDGDTDTDCAGKDDFSLCNLDTTTSSVGDLSYDICAGEVCVSPGACNNATCNAPGPHFPLPDTGVRLCSNDTSEMICPSTTEEFYGQDAQYGWDQTHEASERYSRDTSFTGQPLVTDVVTELMWQGCEDGRTGDDCSIGTSNLPYWVVALSTCDSLSWGGHNDWRVPDEYELQSILDYSKTSGPFIDLDAFPESSSGRVWTSSSFVDESESLNWAWHVNFENGGVDYYYKSSGSATRCVREDPTPRPARYTRDTSVAGQPEVVDNSTGLIWQGCPLGVTGDSCETGTASPTNWSFALSTCEGTTWAEETNWRLPNVNELRSIVDNHQEGPLINPSVFLAATENLAVWTSSTRGGSPDLAWYVDFEDGTAHSIDKTTTRYVRCVR